MLTNLFISNIVLIEKLDISLEGGFCVLTGETGAGKSILLDSLGLALGKRGSAGLIRSGEKQGSVTATFAITSLPFLNNLLEENGIEVAPEIMLRRVIYADGRSKAFVNDTPVGVGLLADIAQYLIEIHGQHDQRGLLNAKTHRHVLDQYGNLAIDLGKCKETYQKYSALKAGLAKLKEDEVKAAADEDFLKFVLNELEQLAPVAGLESELSDKRSALLNKEKITETISSASAVISESDAESAINSAQNILLKNAQLNSNFEQIAQMLERAAIEVGEALSSLENEASKIEDSDENLEEIEERLFGLRNAARKYNVQVDELEDYKESVRQKLELISNKDEHIARLEAELSQAKKLYVQAAGVLSEARKKAAKSLELVLQKELAPLKMENTRLQVAIEQVDESGWSADGFDKVAFLVSTNPGSPFAPIAKIASGGELSRFMLALKVVLSDVKSVPTMIFDEVDTGIGGAVADSVGRRLGALGKKLQVFAITHQPQVAARGSFHLKVQKLQDKDATTTTVNPLSQEQRREELARMLAGENITDEARSAAESLLG